MALFQCQISTKAIFLLYNSLLVCPPMYSEIQDLSISPPAPRLVHVQALSAAGAACMEVHMLLLLCCYSNHPGECYWDFAATDPLSEWSLAQKK